MAKIKFSIDVMQNISFFESLTGARVKDCIKNDSITFIIQQDQMGKAIGKQGSNIKRVESALKKKIRLVEFSDDVVQFVQNLIFPLKADEIKNDDGIVSIFCRDTKTKGMIIGRDKHNINNVVDIVKRYFDITEIKVL